METTVTVERLANEEEEEEFLPSHEILRENLKGTRKIRAKKKPGTLYKCKICHEQFADKSLLTSHEKTHDPVNPFACSLCSHKTTRRKYLTRHISRVHNKQNYKAECSVCKKRFFQKTRLDLHMLVHTGEKPFKCDVCGKGFNARYSLKTHMLIHTNEKPFKCAFCEYACRDCSTLRKHQSKHLGTSYKYHCQECPKKYNEKCTLQEHINVVHRRIERVLTKCPICDKGFTNKWNMAKHIRSVHDKSESCDCGICGKRLTNFSNLRMHMRSHLDIKPYKCSHPGCTHRYKDRGTLKKHERIHDPEQHVICNECGRSFTRKARLIKHFAQHEPRVKNVACPFCKTCFYNKNYLLQHLRYVHGRREKFICDMCGFESYNKPGLVTHIKHIHSLKDTQCHVCRKIFKRKINLIKHYPSKHNMLYKTREKKPMVQIKDEPLDYQSDVEIDLLDIDKEEPFAGFDLDPDSQHEFKLPRSLPQDLNASDDIGRNNFNDLARTQQIHPMMVEFPDIQKEICDDTNTTVHNRQIVSNSEEQYFEDKMIENTTDSTEYKNTDVTDYDSKEEIKEGELSEEKEKKDEIRKEEKREEVGKEEDKKEEGKLEVRGIEKEVESGRRTMQVDEFLKHVLSEKEISDMQQQAIDEESEEFVNSKIDELIEKSNIKNGLRKKQFTYKKLERLRDDEIKEFLLNNSSSEMNRQMITPLERKKKREGQKEREGKKKKKPKIKVGENNEYKISKKKLSTVKGRKKVQYSRKTKSKLSTYEEDSTDGVKETEDKEKHETDKESKTTKKQNSGIKLKIDMHQCYVCFKLYQTKSQLLEHCKEHFDVCNETTLKKCPLCPYVTHRNIKRHMRLKHKQNINFSFMRIKDRKTHENGSRYYFDVDSENIKKMEIIPSVKILNKKASMELDRRNREIKDKSVLKRKLVRKGKEWIVETENVDVSEHVVPKLKQNDNYLAKMKMLSVKSKHNKTKMLYPCNGCDKICQNLSALTLHMRRHDPNAKPFKPRNWKQKQKGTTELQDEKTKRIHVSHRDVIPKPIVNKHKCDPKLKAFYESNIRGGDIEFWQFLKIYNKMDRENVNDFKDLEARTDFGIHFNENNNQNTTENSSDPDNASNTDISNVNNEITTKNSSNRNNASNTETSKKKSENVNTKIATTKKKIGKVKYVRKIQLSKEEYNRRMDLKNKLREQIAKSNNPIEGC